MIRRPPGPKNYLYLSNLIGMHSNRLRFVQRLAREYGEINYAQIGGMDVYFLHRPDDVRDVLVTHDRLFTKGYALQQAKVLLGEGLLTSEGALHQKQRRLMQPAFHHERIAGYARTMVELSEAMMTRWKDGAEIDIHAEMMHLTMQIVGQTLFGKAIFAEANDISESMDAFMRQFPRLMNPLRPILDALPLPGTLRWRKAQGILDKFIGETIKERRATGEDRGDLLSMLLSAQDAEGDGTGMNDRQVRDEVMTLFLAGHETTANALTWTWYLLGQYPEVEQKVHEEIEAVLGGRTPSFGDVPKLTYLRQVFSESMRVYPPAWIIGRRAIADVEIGGYTIPKRAIVIVSPYIVHHQAKYFPDPDKFDPSRWTKDAEQTRPKFAYFPFAAGSRSCIGEAFAWTEGILVLAAIAQRWKLNVLPGQKIGLLPMVTLRPDRPVRVRLEEQSESSALREREPQLA